MKRFFNSSDERFLKEQSFFMFEEMSNGVYLTVKDRLGRYMEFTNIQSVLSELNGENKTVVVSRGGGSGYANWNFERQGR